jgi:hypothetical protein
MMDKGQNVTHQGQSPSECEKTAGSLEMLRVGRGERSPPSELPTAHQRNNLSLVLPEMSADCSGGLEVSTAVQYPQDARFKTNPLH